MCYQKIITSAAPFCARNSYLRSKLSKKYYKTNYNFLHIIKTALVSSTKMCVLLFQTTLQKVLKFLKITVKSYIGKIDFKGPFTNNALYLNTMKR